MIEIEEETPTMIESKLSLMQHVVAVSYHWHDEAGQKEMVDYWLEECKDDLRKFVIVAASLLGCK